MIRSVADLRDRPDSRTEQGSSNPPSPLRVTVASGDIPGFEHRFTKSFRIGRDDACDVSIKSDLVSRVHAEVAWRDGEWWITDAGSTNGIYVDGERVECVPLRDRADVRFARQGPVLAFVVETDVPPRRARDPSPSPSAEQRPRDAQPRAAGRLRGRKTSEPGSSEPVADSARKPMDRRPSRGTSSSTPAKRAADAAARGAQPADRRRKGSLTDYIDHYVKGQTSDEAGDHTMMIRRAVATVQKKQRRRYVGMIAVALLLVVAAGIYAAYQRAETRRVQDAAAGLFTQMKELDLQIVQVKAIVESTGNGSIVEQLQRLEQSRERMAQRYDGYVTELGEYRALTEEEKVIHKVARAFNESELVMPAAFARAVNRMIADYWQTTGRERFIRAVNEAEGKGYVPRIVRTLRTHGLPPQFFYLALQESNFNVHAIGPPTRWGRAKGMWQFIPSTATHYGLDPGPYKDADVVDPQDERQDFGRSTEAAARYLQTIYGTLAQASGLLVVASYNWGEHAVANKLGDLAGPQTIPKEALEGIPEDPASRNYWNFLGVYRDRMPDETKDYVLKIFAAAVIGENPRLFGFDMDNPIARYVDGAG